MSESKVDEECWNGQGHGSNVLRHAVVIPLYGEYPADLSQQVLSLACAGLVVILVQNNPGATVSLPSPLRVAVENDSRVNCISNGNQGGVAGGFNRGIEAAIALGVQWITLLDQDSRLEPQDLARLLEPWQALPGLSLMVGPLVWDGRRQQMHGRRRFRHFQGYLQTRLLISSGTTFNVADWPLLGPMCEWLHVDYVDHFWCFHAQSKGFVLLHHPQITLVQAFGNRHPNPFCRLIGMELYSPMRHYYSLRNLRLLIKNQEVPLDLRLKEFSKMMAKPLLWLLFEPRRVENLHAIIHALRSSLPLSLGRCST